MNKLYQFFLLNLSMNIVGFFFLSVPCNFSVYFSNEQYNTSIMLNNLLFSNWLLFFTKQHSVAAKRNTQDVKQFKWTKVNISERKPAIATCESGRLTNGNFKHTC